MMSSRVTPARMTLRAIVHATEDIEKVKKAIENVLGEKIELKTVRTKGYFGNEITILSGEVSKKKAIINLLTKIFSEKTNYEFLLSTLDDRIDEKLRLYIRLDKQEAYRGEMIVTEGDDVISLVISFNVYPKKKEILMKWLKELKKPHS
ncbi:MAG TPA: hypothetical protein ENK81_03235 [Euryarchaeota archaeon]|nr:hypothetical protein [Euryarchaeota archaeon]